MYEDEINELLKSVNDTSKCANPACNGSLICQRGMYDVREQEKQYGLMCDLCNGVIASNKVMTVTCGNCRRLINLFFTNKRIRAFALQCRKCGGTQGDELRLFSRFKLFIYKLKQLIK